MTQELPLRIDRIFILSRLVMSHAGMILRSPKRNEHDIRIDILFAGTCAVKLRRRLPTLAVRHPTDREIRDVEHDMGLKIVGPASLNLYMIEGGPSLGYVVASGMWMSTDREADTDPSPLLGNWECGPIAKAEGPLVQFV